MTPRLAALILLFAQASFAPAAAQQGAECRDKPLPELVEGRAFAVDGDTLAFPGQPRVRMWGIDAPELRDPATKQETRAGMQARVALADLLAGEAPTRCVPTKWDRYCRLVAVCHIAGSDVALRMLEQGMAYTAWLDDTPGKTGATPDRYAAVERLARVERRGLWKGWLD